jgi:phosphoribosyl-AMP cyclohydrolase
MIELEFDKLCGLVPAIVQDYRSSEVLMLAFMNEEAWRKTLDTGIAHYWSRSRKQLWKKGESSGNIQEVKEIRVDCDRDSVLIKVHQVGEAACHTGHRSCFFNLIRDGEVVEDGQVIFDPKDKYGERK